MLQRDGSLVNDFGNFQLDSREGIRRILKMTKFVLEMMNACMYDDESYLSRSFLWRRVFFLVERRGFTTIPRFSTESIVEIRGKIQYMFTTFWIENPGIVGKVLRCNAWSLMEAASSSSWTTSTKTYSSATIYKLRLHYNTKTSGLDRKE